MSDYEIRLSQIREILNRGLWQPDYEAILRHSYSRFIKECDVVVDVGVHVGLHLEQFINLVGPSGRVIGFEPIPELFTEVAHRFSAPHVELHNIALGSVSGTSSFVVARGALGESGLKERVFNAGNEVRPESIEVRVAKLDDLLAGVEALDYMKMDIEGGEIDSLRGSTRLIHQHRPVISLEYGWAGYTAYGYNADTLYELASSWDYVLFDLFWNSLEKRDDWRLACDSIYWDFFMVPKERLSPLLDAVRA